MLKVLRCKEEKAENIEFDAYIPINIEFGLWDISKEPTIYWRTGDFKKSLIEIGVGKNTGDIRSITLSLSKSVYAMNSLNTEGLNIARGVPVVEVGKFINKTYIDEDSEFNVYIGESEVYVLFSQNKIVSLVRNNNVEFRLDNNGMICGIAVKDIGENERIILKEALK